MNVTDYRYKNTSLQYIHVYNKLRFTYSLKRIHTHIATV